MRRPLLLALPLALAACAGRTPAGSPPLDGAPTPARPGLPAAGPGESVAEYDLNRDGKPDVWKVIRRTAEGKEVTVRSQRDLNGDGKVDVWETFDEAGNPVTQTFDTDFDGKPDLVLHFEKGQLVRKEMSFGFDGKPRAWLYYEKGKLVRKERDDDGDGRVDTWEYWEDGELDRVGIDLDGDGRVDRWEQRKPQTAGGGKKP
ncbi:MAG TPA: hypothetical protein VFR85_03750 [Anaeromyxobacteraceae bacterium]|nr:hypothetical protein [Anaeromyxobacteraceae bacterium]